MRIIRCGLLLHMSVCLSVCLCVRVRLHITYLCVSVGYERESSETGEPIEVTRCR